jgi:hypothetical protein
LDRNKTTNDIPTWDDLKPYVGGGDGEILKCPQGGIYTIEKNWRFSDLFAQQHRHSGAHFALSQTQTP